MSNLRFDILGVGKPDSIYLSLGDESKVLITSGLSGIEISRTDKLHLLSIVDTLRFIYDDVLYLINSDDELLCSDVFKLSSQESACGLLVAVVLDANDSEFTFTLTDGRGLFVKSVSNKDDAVEWLESMIYKLADCARAIEGDTKDV